MDGLDAAALVKEARARADLSQRALAERAGTSQSVVARIELGVTSPTIATLNRLLEAAGQEPRVRLHGRGDAAVPDALTLARRIRDFFDSAPVAGFASAYLFGSTARGTRHSGSDLDVAVLLDPSVHPRRRDRNEVRVGLGSRLVSATGVNDVDLVILNDAPPGLGRAIVVEGERLACAAPQLDHAFVRNVQLRWCDVAPFLRRTAAVKLEAVTR